ncbi:alpha-(1,3)-fucosyltransferase C-like [Hyposmocoma kahamanoa]|uniref:alpha-(1,3)-fucosyltransferase C-like n=1 Tax=Hyposmocoma kahamanoa TaxID=1477025 RepID=UPI000E6D9AC9|nr:alpha-(1,3)-fucosyltransferase C-like [Hyposmocoma kahamanoa]XP_026333256.1 alpha-(1,3)-fucosyltransferase C-like [Hyposmocoma kahamanoa]
MQWMKVTQMNKTSSHIENKLRYKHIAAAWIASNCETVDRLDYVHVLQKELSKYGHRVDVYGKCGNLQCPRKEAMDECFALIEQDYYFYLAFENSNSQDYVTEKLLHALEHYTVPVVLGGANYSRFMPKGIYLDAGRLGPERLAKRMNEIMNDEEKYYEFFKWHGYYSFHDTVEDRYHREICGLCDLLNNKTRMKQTSIWHNLIQWWNVPFPATRPEWHLVLDDDDVVDTGIQGFANKLYNYVFES